MWSLLSTLYILINHRVAVWRAELSNRRRVNDTAAETTARVSFYGAAGDGEGNPDRQKSSPFKAFRMPISLYCLSDGAQMRSYACRTNFRNNEPHSRN